MSEASALSTVFSPQVFPTEYRDGSAFLRSEPRLARLVELARERFAAAEVWLFGSRARGDARPDSDWDIMIVVDDDVPDDTLDPAALWSLGRHAGLVADVVGDRISDMLSAQDVATTLSYDIKREGVRLG